MKPVPVESTKSILEFLEQMRKERDDLNALIGGLERRLGISGGQTATPTPLNAAPTVKVSVNDVPVGFFHNLTQAQAAEKLLKLNPGQPLTTQELLETFRKSGMNLNPKNATTILYTALSRSSKFERVAGKAWGLSEWYPESKRKQDPKKDEETEK